MATAYSGVLISRDNAGPAGLAVGAPRRPTLLRRSTGGVKPAGSDNFFHYVPESPGSSLESPRVTGLGRNCVSPGANYPPQDHPKLYAYDWRAGRTLPEHQVILLTDAAGEFESEATGRVRLAGDVLLFLFPGVWHRYRPLAGGGWTERWVSLHGEPFRRRLAEAGVAPANAIAAPESTARLRLMFELLTDAARNNPAGGGMDPTPLAYQFFDEAVRQATDVQLAAEEVTVTHPEQVEDEIVRRALQIIWNHQHSPPLGVTDVARQLPVTRRTLDRKFSESLGRTVLDEINACRLSRAKRLLADTDAPVKAVAYLAGFPSRERLRLAFLNHEGMPPSEYREAVRKDRAKNEV